MRSLQEAIGRELMWRQRALFSPSYDLVDPESRAGEPYATMLWREGFLSWGSKAEARSGDGAWRFLLRGFFGDRVLVLGAGDAAVATFRQGWRRGILTTQDGRELTWRRASLLSREWRFEDSNGVPVVTFRTRFQILRGVGRVAFESSAASPGDQALLACLGWYLLLRRRARAARGAT
jgi:hypothetical protein